jgi:hypothetical protein
MAGFRNSGAIDVLFVDNVDFTGAAIPSPTITTDGQLIIGSTAAPNLKIGTLTSPTGTVTIGYANPNITIDVPGAGTAWSEKAINFNAVADNGYFCTAALTVTLPAGVLGDTIIIDADTAGIVIIQAAAGQSIRVGNSISAVAGTAASTKQGDSLTLTFRASTLTWFASSSVGNWTIT